MNMEKTFAMISLGCAKNLVNSEQMLYLMSEAGFSLVPEAEGADLAIVNTCGFIDAAKTEAIDNILELAELKKQGKLGGLIVTGCLAERYKDSILSELPEIDAVLGVGNFKDIVAAANTVMEGRNLSLFGSNSAPVDEIPRVVSTGPAWAYLRIAEGCNNFCAFCAIPYIRGRYRSRSMENI
ncbi:MAG: 30S ribosomal protein S12 methylthiotransferase RimO, partial [Dysosmobacter sp.]